MNKDTKSPFPIKELQMTMSRDKVMFKLMTDLLKIHNQFAQKVADLDEIVSKKIGPKGPKPVAGIDFPFPKDGENYVLTEADKNEIAKKIDVPVVEKVIEKTETKIIKEVPGKISEKDKREMINVLSSLIKVSEPQSIPTIEEIIIQLRKKKLKTDDIFDLNEKFEVLRREIRSASKMRGGGDTVSAGTNIAITVDSNGVKVISSTGSGSATAPTSGVVNGVNRTFVFATAPTILVVDNVNVMRKTPNVGEANWTGTTTVILTVAPTTDIYQLV